jgi:predicted amidohydrolase YtcJ
MIGSAHIGAAPELNRVANSTGIRLAGVKFMDVARWETPRLVRAVIDALSRGLDCAFHSTEVEELEAALNAIELSRERVPAEALDSTICRIEHGGLIPPEYPERLGALGAWVVTNPGFTYYRGVKYAAEPGLIPYLYRARSLTNAGVGLAAGSDAPVTPAKPLVAIAAAVSRLSIEGYELARSERLAMGEAFALFTTSASFLSRLGAGEITPGCLANLIVLPTDPMALKPAELVNLAVDLTIVGGRVVYERGRPVIAHSAGESLPFA